MTTNMNPLHHLSERTTALTRRWFLRDCGVGLAGIAMNSLLTREASAALQNAAPKGPHFPAKAKRVIWSYSTRSRS
jgi:hypothetical protein